VTVSLFAKTAARIKVLFGVETFGN